MLITVQPDPNWQLSLAQLSPSLFFIFEIILISYDILSFIVEVTFKFKVIFIVS